MIYLAPEHRILRYLAKIKKSNSLSVAHLMCMVKGSNDYKQLQYIESRRKKGEDISETIKKTDGKIDKQKLKNLFFRRKTLTFKQFDNAILFLEKEKFVKKDEFEAENIAVTKHDEMEKKQIEENIFSEKLKKEKK